MCENPFAIIYGPFEHLQYPITMTKGVNGVVRGPNNQCLRINGSVAAGSTLSLGACTGALPGGRSRPTERCEPAISA